MQKACPAPRGEQIIIFTEYLDKYSSLSCNSMDHRIFVEHVELGEIRTAETSSEEWF